MPMRFTFEIGVSLRLTFRTSFHLFYTWHNSTNDSCCRRVSLSTSPHYMFKVQKRLLGLRLKVEITVLRSTLNKLWVVTLIIYGSCRDVARIPPCVQTQTSRAPAWDSKARSARQILRGCEQFLWLCRRSNTQKPVCPDDG